MKGAAGVFVTLKRGAVVRGSIGTVLPTQPNLYAEIIFNAISAATRDPRFSPVQLSETSKLKIIVDLLTEPEQILDIADQDPHKYGLIVQQGDKRGLVLPDSGEISTAEEQLELARQRAGITDQAVVDLFRFAVTRFQE